MNRIFFKVLGVLVALALVLSVGAVAGGSAVYFISRYASPKVMVSAQEPEGDPELGVVITVVDAAGPAAEAGVVRGDILQQIDGQSVEDMVEVIEIIEDLEPGDEVILTVLHGDDLLTLAVTLGESDGRAYLGLASCRGLFHETMRLPLDLSGVLVIDVVDGTPAEEAGLKAGDIILAVDDQELGAEDSLADLIGGYQPGDRVSLEVQRPGETESLKFTVELGSHPDDESKAYLGIKYQPMPLMRSFEGQTRPFGRFDEFKFDDLPFLLPEGKMAQGVILRQVVKDSPASAAGLQERDVITAIEGQEIDSPDALAEAITGRKPGDEIALTVYRPGEKELLEIEVVLGQHPDDEEKAYLGVSPGGFLHLKHFEGDGPGTKLDSLPHFDFDWQRPDEWFGKGI